MGSALQELSRLGQGEVSSDPVLGLEERLARVERTANIHDPGRGAFTPTNRIFVCEGDNNADRGASMRKRDWISERPVRDRLSPLGRFQRECSPYCEPYQLSAILSVLLFPLPPTPSILYLSPIAVVLASVRVSPIIHFGASLHRSFLSSSLIALPASLVSVESILYRHHPFRILCSAATSTADNSRHAEYDTFGNDDDDE